MAHRAAMIGGAFSIDPNPTGGTLVTVSVPTVTKHPAPRPEPVLA
jgi:hypothetical protein